MNQKIEKPHFANIENPDIDWAVRYYTESYLEHPACTQEVLIEQILGHIITSAAGEYAELKKYSSNKNTNRLVEIADFLQSEIPNVSAKMLETYKMMLTLKCGLQFEFSHYSRTEIRFVLTHADAFMQCGSLSWQKRQSMITFFTFIEDNYSQWNVELQRYAFELSKARMTAKIERTAIDSLVLQKLRDEGFEFYVTSMKANDKITVKISKSQKTTFYLPHKTFVEKIDKVIAGIKAIKAFAEENGRFYVENIVKMDNNRWEK
ncbi:MAG: hypothetical protein IKR41_02980 [Bacteroidales bacterium]|nr:hypothetical protein [Bacteroidales bacterium]